MIIKNVTNFIAQSPFYQDDVCRQIITYIYLSVGFPLCVFVLYRLLH